MLSIIDQSALKSLILQPNVVGQTEGEGFIVLWFAQWLQLHVFLFRWKQWDSDGTDGLKISKNEQ